MKIDESQFAEELAAGDLAECVDLGAAKVIPNARLRFEPMGRVRASNDMTWTVRFRETGKPMLEPPRHSRVIPVQVVEDGVASAGFAISDIQTISLAQQGGRRLACAARAALRGADAFRILAA